MEKQNRTLSITLKSDLCAGSGYSYGGIINNDICYDDCGLPYIPAKRMKGCLREAAEIIGISEKEISVFFGESGSDRIRGIVIENAYLEHYDELYQELKGIPQKLKKYVTPQSILEQFTTVRTQTKIGENGAAKDKSLRSFRSINHYSPVERGQEMKFIAKIDFVGLNEEEIIKFEQIAKALRNMGMNRNRGLGSVRCKLNEEKDGNRPEEGVNENRILTKDKENKKYEFIGLDEIEEHDDAVYQCSYTIRNTSPLVFNTEHNYSTEKYISGQTMLGYFAWAYLRNGKEAKEEFEELFLKNQVIFSNLYPCEEPETEAETVDNTTPFYRNPMKKAVKVYYPAPLYINQMKKTEKYVNITKLIPAPPEACTEKNLKAEYASEHGNRPRRLHDKFVWTDGKNISVKEVETDIVYHHTKKSEKQNSSGGDLLYSFEAIRTHQFFTGSITGKGKHIKKLARLLENNSIQLGKSKSSQYGNCRLAGIVKVRKVGEVKKKYQRGCKILVTLQGDGIFLNKAGYTVSCNEVREAVRQALHIKEAKSNTSDKLYSELQVRKQIGFYGKWNLKRQAIPIVCAGSTFEFLLGEDIEISEQDLYVGERIGEGFGKLSIMENNGEDCRLIESNEIFDKTKEIKLAKEICRRVLLKEMKNELLNKSLQENVQMKNSTMVGKLTFMLAESMQEFPDDRQKAYQSFCEKIENIKDKEKREQIAGVKGRLICEGNKLDVNELQYLKHIIDLVKIYCEFVDEGDADELSQSVEKVSAQNETKVSSQLEGDKRESLRNWNEVLGEELKQELKDLWSDYFLGILTLAKYENRKSAEKKSEKKED